MIAMESLYENVFHQDWDTTLNNLPESSLFYHENLEFIQNQEKNGLILSKNTKDMLLMILEHLSKTNDVTVLNTFKKELKETRPKSFLYSDISSEEKKVMMKIIRQWVVERVGMLISNN